MAHSRSLELAVLLLLAILLPSVHALAVDNTRTSNVTVFAPPTVCEPCRPCDFSDDCECTTECRSYVPGVDVKPGESETISVPEKEFPLQFLTVEVEGARYHVKANDLELVTRTATVVVTVEKCGEEGVAARVFPNPEFPGSDQICLVPGSRFGP